MPAIFPRVGIDLRHILKTHSGGIAPLIAETVRALHEQCADWNIHIFGTMFNRNLIDIADKSVTHHTLPICNYYKAMQSILLKEEIDVLLRSFPDDDDLEFPFSRQIILIPDLQHEFFPDFFDPHTLANRRRNFSRLIQRCGAIATISQHAKATIVQHWPGRSSEIFVMAPSSQILDVGIDGVTAPFKEAVRALQPYFFYPANCWPHKNHRALLEAFTKLKSNNVFSAYNLVLTGDPSGSAKLLSACGAGGVHHLGFVSKPELVYLYRNAVALTFVSLFEGFGMPVLEAFGLGCPVICSNTSSLPEVSEDAALLCSPTEPDAIVRAMERVALDPALRQTLIDRGCERFKAYSWASAAFSLKEAFLRVVEPSQRRATRSKNARSCPRVSIVTPSYNQGRFLRRTIESVLNQSYPNIEYIVMDGGSTDDSVEILKSYGERVRWVSERDRGQTDAINRGLARSSGDILAYLNSDDTLEPDAIQAVVNCFEDEPEIGLIYGKANYIDTNDDVIGQYSTREYSFQQLMNDCCVCQPAAFWRSSVAEKIGPFDDKLDMVMDYDYWIRIAKAGIGIRHLPRILANSRLYPETKTMSARGKIYEEIFRISMRHAGYVSRNYAEGYWHHRLFERNDLFAKAARRVPHARRLFVEYSAHRYGGGSRTFVGSAGHIFRMVGSQALARVGSGRRNARAIGKHKPAVVGVHLDNSLEPTVVMGGSPTRQRRLFLTGKSPIDNKLRVESGDRILLERDLAADADVRMEFSGVADEIRLVFDSFLVDRASRKIAFHVEETNCFAEHEL